MRPLAYQKVLVFGLGKSGEAAAQALAASNVQFFVYDDKLRGGIVPDGANFEGLGSALAAGGRLLSREQAETHEFDLCVVNPDVPFSHPLCVLLEERGVPVVSEIELGYLLCEAPIAAITGTNGKSTTTALAAHMLSASGITTHVGGNLSAEGLEAPLSKLAAAAKSTDVVVAEVSNLQLQRCYQFRPKVAALLNIGHDHDDRHASHEEYVSAKMRLFQNHDSSDIAVFGLDQAILADLAASIASPKMWFSVDTIVESGACIAGGHYVLCDLQQQQAICRVDEPILWTSYDRSNILAAACIAWAMGGTIEGIRTGALEFPGLSDRMEFCGQINGVPWFNSSMCTNPEAGIAAIEAIAEKYNPIVIAGGHDKGLEYAQWGQTAARLVSQLLLIGKGGGKLAEAAQKAGAKNIQSFETLPEATRQAYALAKPGDAVILAPAMASFGEFSDFRERGRRFREIAATYLTRQGFSDVQ